MRITGRDPIAGDASAKAVDMRKRGARSAGVGETHRLKIEAARIRE